MTTNVTICNLALLRIGSRDPIDSLEEATTEAQACNILFEHCRDVLLASFPWRFAERRQTLATLDTVTRANWGYAYALPADLLVPRSITGAVRVPSADSRIPFAIEAGDSGGSPILVSDQATVELVYTAKVTSAALFPPLFADALVWLIAAELAVALPNKADYRNQALQRYEQQLSRATAIELSQGTDAEPDPGLITARV